MQWLVVQINGEDFVLTTWNCFIVVHAEQWKSHDHVMIFHDDEWGAVWDQPNLIKRMNDTENYRYEWNPMPDDNVIQEYGLHVINKKKNISETEITGFQRELEGGIDWTELFDEQ